MKLTTLIIFSFVFLFIIGCSKDTTFKDLTNDIKYFDVSSDDDPTIGSENALVTIVAFEDFQCSFCQRFNWEVFPSLKKEYIDTGKVKFVYRDYPISNKHPMAQKAAEAAECSHEQGKFWEYHDILFEKQNFFTIDNFKKWASGLDIDTEKFNECIDSGKMELEVQKDYADGTTYEVDSTPTIFINGVPIKGLYPYKAYKEIIEYELSLLKS
jgi:protein-disulfide isomerase